MGNIESDRKAGDYRTQVVGSLGEIGRARWQRLLALAQCAYDDPERSDATRASAESELSPFVGYDWLEALERTGCVGGDSGWSPLHAVVEDAEGTLVAAAPCYLKEHSYGEYVFDWAWADAYARHGLQYYPKLLAASPFTPVPGPRLLAGSPQARAALAVALRLLAQQSGLSSAHVLFTGAEDTRALAAAGWMIRRGVQFHWHNAAFADFDAYLSSLVQPKRKKVRAERRKVQEAGVMLRRLSGADIRPSHWDFFYRCYQRTYSEHYSHPYLSREFFEEIGARMAEQVLLVVAERELQPIASALLVFDGSGLYGRYWGALERVPCLHFEASYYQPIEFAIERGLGRFEGGAQGEHKMARGFLPVPTHSAHWLAHPAFADAVERFLEREGHGIEAYLTELDERSPLQRTATGPARAGASPPARPERARRHRPGPSGRVATVCPPPVRQRNRRGAIDDQNAGFSAAPW
ncbi:MAG: N-acetyltransferase [Burkholderiales bacterium]|nr:MAG: N-acetyltransferase [Burkholderiales bacterium]